MTNIRTVLQLFDLETSGFEAVEALHLFSNPHGEKATLSTLPVSVLQAQGVQAYFAPRFERGQVFETAADMVEANIPVDCYMIGEASEEKLELNIPDLSNIDSVLELFTDEYSYSEYYNSSAYITLEPLDLTIEVELGECLDYLGLTQSSTSLSGGFEEIRVTSCYSKEEDKVYILLHYCG